MINRLTSLTKCEKNGTYCANGALSEGETSGARNGKGRAEREVPGLLAIHFYYARGF